VFPVPVIAKLEDLSPDTFSLKVTVNLTVLLVAGLGSARLIETTFGAIEYW
jgi:hypothetical protein